MMITDAFTFFNELDLLRLRLIELDPVVDQFILVEGDRTFQNKPKPFYFEENKHQFGRWLDKITHVQLELPEHGSSWDREYFSRNAIKDAWKWGGVLIASDLDEIPRREAIACLKPMPAQVVALGTRNFSFFINAEEESGGHAIKAMLPSALAGRTIHEIRTQPNDPVITNAGWSFSSLGTPEEISYKLKSFAHQELNVARYTSPTQIQARMGSLTDIIDRGRLTRVEIDDSWPHAVREEPEIWSKYVSR